MKSLFKSIALFGILSLAIYGCKKETKATCNDGIKNGTETDIDCGGSCTACLTNGCNNSAHSGYTTIDTDACGDGAHADRLDGTRLEYKYEAQADSLWFLLTVNSITATQGIGVNVMLNIPGGGSTFNFWGANNTDAFHRLLTMWVTGTAPSAYTGTIGIADATGVAADNDNNLIQNNISITVNTTDKTILLGLKRADLIPDALFTGASITVKVAAAVGANNGWNDDIYHANTSITLVKYVPGANLATVTTTAATNITTTGATSGGEVTSDGGGTVTERGIVFATHFNPTVADTKVTSGSGTGVFSANMTGLTVTTLYYVRAFATNSAGTAYGNQVTFTSSAISILPTVRTDTVTLILDNNAYGAGTITDPGNTPVTEEGLVYATHTGPTVADNKVYITTYSPSFQLPISPLFPVTTYYVRAYAINGGGTVYGNERSFTTLSVCAAVTDVEGNTYNAVRIGGQCWTTENLRTAHYNNNVAITEVEYWSDWATIFNNNTQMPAWCFANGDSTNNVPYGKLYNWWAVTPGNLCPVGWHVPSEAEYQDLSFYLGGDGISGGKMKTVSLWNAPNTGSDNSSGFTAIPSGERTPGGNFQGMPGGDCFFWSSTPLSGTTARARSIFNSGTYNHEASPNKEHGCAVRCIKD